jgi:hypothetical protein
MKLKIRIIHGVLIYLVGAALLVSPWIIANDEVVMARLILIVAGLTSLVLGIASKYELGLLRLIQYKEYLLSTMLLGMFVFFSPILFGFVDSTALPHFILGSLMLLLPYLNYRLHFSSRRSIPTL